MEEKSYKEKKKKEIKKSILLFLGVILVFFLIFEIGLRILNYPTYGFQEGFFQADEIIGYRLSPNYSGVQSSYHRLVEINTNSKGLRDFREYTYEKGDKQRILVLGDSYSFGNAVELEDSYVELLRQSFNEEVEIINTGVSGYGINNEYLYFINEGLRYNPDIILLQFCVNDWESYKIIKENDIEKIDLRNSLTASKEGILISNVKKRLSSSIHLFFLMKLRSYNFLYSKAKLIISKINSAEKQEAPVFYMPKDSKEYAESYEGYFNLLKKLKESTNAKIILFSGPHILYLTDSEKIMQEYNLNYSMEPNQVEESLEQMTKDLQIDFIRIQSNDPDIFLKVDGHWTPRGNQIIADELYLKLKDKL